MQHDAIDKKEGLSLLIDDFPVMGHAVEDVGGDFAVEGTALDSSDDSAIRNVDGQYLCRAIVGKKESILNSGGGSKVECAPLASCLLAVS